MPGTTPNRAYPYPLDGDAIDVAGDIERLALALDVEAGPAGPAGAMPGGTVVMTVATVAPTGFAMLAGGTILNAQTLYPETWAAAPSAWKVSTSLQLPDYRGFFVVGASGARPVGTQGGTATRQLAASHLPQHVHGGSSGAENATHIHGASEVAAGGHVHNPAAGPYAFVVQRGGGGAAIQFIAGPNEITDSSTTDNQGSHVHALSIGGQSANHAHGITTDGGPGSATAFDITPPFCSLNLMLRLR